MATLAVNKQAKFNYEVLKSFEAGLVLIGPEVKSIKAGQINLRGAYISKRQDSEGRPEFWLVGAHVSQYKYATIADYQPERPRKLLLNKQEIDYLLGKAEEKGLTIIPIRVYTKGSLIKLEFAVAKGKKKHDKRQSIKQRDIDRDVQRALKGDY